MAMWLRALVIYTKDQGLIPRTYSAGSHPTAPGNRMPSSPCYEHMHSHAHTHSITLTHTDTPKKQSFENWHHKDMNILL